MTRAKAHSHKDDRLTPELKHTVRKMIRDAIRYQNKQVLFTCCDCCFYIPAHGRTHRPAKCDLDADNRLVFAKRMPTQLPDCFTFNPLASAFAGILELIYSLGIDTEQGWATVIGRLAVRADRYGYITGVTQKNLEKYGSEI